MLNTLDAQVESGIQADNMEHFERPLSRERTKDYALSTGIEPRLATQLVHTAQRRVIDLPDDDDGSAASHFAPSPRGLLTAVNDALAA